jgi:hypothetical protein
MSLGGNRLYQQATGGGVLTSKEWSNHTKARTKWVTSLLTIAPRMATEDFDLPPSIFLLAIIPPR